MSHALVTGASSGIGRTLARALAAEGWTLTLVARREQQLRELADSLPTECLVRPADLSEGSAVSEVLAHAVAALGPVDLLVNNAGLQVIGPTSEVDPERGAASLRLNLEIPVRFWTAVLPGMLERRAGTIVNIASMAALAPTPGMSWYNASKAGLAGASEALAGELQGTGVRVLTVYPGIIASTAMGQSGLDAYGDNLALSLQPRGTEEELARRILRAVDRGQRRLIYPWIYWTARWFPAVTRWVMDLATPSLHR